MEYVEEYDKQGRITKTSCDSNGDGVFDIFCERNEQGTITKKLVDKDDDGKLDFYKTF